jgi:hypothetical protein
VVQWVLFPRRPWNYFLVTMRNSFIEHYTVVFATFLRINQRGEENELYTLDDFGTNIPRLFTCYDGPQDDAVIGKSKAFT